MTNLDNSSSVQKDFEFIGLTYGGIHSSELGLTVVAPSNFFSEPLFAEFEDKTIEVDGRDGAYYFGTRVKAKSLEVSFAFDNVSSEQKRKIKIWLNPKKMSLLSFDSCPYKYYIVKPQSPPVFNYIPFEIDVDNGKSHLFKGDLTVSFIAHDPYGYSEYFTVGDVPVWNGESFETGVYSSINVPGWFGESGLFLSNEGNFLQFNSKEGVQLLDPQINENGNILYGGEECVFYNGGETESPVSFEMKLEYSNFPVAGLSIMNTVNNTVFELQHPSGVPVLESLNITGICTIYCLPEKGMVYGIFSYLDGVTNKQVTANLGGAFGGNYVYVSPGENIFNLSNSILDSLTVKYKYVYL